MSLIESKTLGTTATSIEFTNIPQNGTDLLVLISTRLSTAALNGRIRFNSDSGTNYSYRVLYGTSSSVASQNFSSQTGIFYGILGGGTNTANSFSTASIYIPNYTLSQNKNTSSEGVSETNDGGAAYQQTSAGLWSNTAAITTITLSVESTATYAANTIASLYRITRA